MLTVTRKIGETIKIGDDIEIVVKDIRTNSVRIGISAPRDVAILRTESLSDNVNPLEFKWFESELPDGVKSLTLHTNRNLTDFRASIDVLATDQYSLGITEFRKVSPKRNFPTLKGAKDFAEALCKRHDSEKNPNLYK